MNSKHKVYITYLFFEEQRLQPILERVTVLLIMTIKTTLIMIINTILIMIINTILITVIWVRWASQPDIVAPPYLTLAPAADFLNIFSQLCLPC